MPFTGSLQQNISFATHALKLFPYDSKMWFCLAVLENRAGNNALAQQPIVKPQRYGFHDPYVYDCIMVGQPFSLTLGSQGSSSK